MQKKLKSLKPKWSGPKSEKKLVGSGRARAEILISLSRRARLGLKFLFLFRAGPGSGRNFKFLLRAGPGRAEIAAMRAGETSSMNS